MSVSKHKILNLRNVDNSNYEQLCASYRGLVSSWNTITNLISTTNVDNLLADLISQSIKPLSEIALFPGLQMLDIGSGAGIPALPIKFAQPEINLTLLEPRRNKSAFLRRVVSELDLEDVTVIRGRLEEFNANTEWLGKFDLITTRGTGDAGKLWPLIRPVAKAGGTIWLFKGAKVEAEAEILSHMISDPIRILQIDNSLSVIEVKLSK